MGLADWFRQAFADERAGYGLDPSPKPARIAPVPPLIAPAPESFAAWRDDPITRFVFAALRQAANEQELAWHDATWRNGGAANQELLIELWTRADSFSAIEEAAYEDFCAWLGVPPLPPEEAEDEAA